MKKQLLTLLNVAVFAVLFMPMISAAQVMRGDDTAYIRPRVGLAYYLGDTEQSPFNMDGDLFNSFPYSAGLEVGYQFSPANSFGLAGTYADYANTTEYVEGLETADMPTTKTSVSLVFRHLFSPQKKLSFYLQTGLHATFGKTAVYGGGTCLTTGNCVEENRTSFGPIIGLGFDWATSERTSFFLESSANIAFPDDAADGWDGGGMFGGDALGYNVFGFKINLKAFHAVEVTDVVCPAQVVDTGSPVTFTGSSNDDATQPVMYRWTFGDGSTAEGMTATHTYDRAGTYTVGFTATNGNGRATSTMNCTVEVQDPCIPASIVSMQASNNAPDTQTAVRFTANVTGTAGTYRWSFGDGETSTQESPSHTYSEAGTYTVTLEVTNCNGTVNRTMSITVSPYEAAICREIMEMSPAFFAQNSSALTDEARDALQDNLEILLQCPNLNVRLEGWAAAGERRPQELSEDRARAVEQFYVDNGVPASRIVSVGMGRAEGSTKKEGAAGYRRVDTIPVR